MHLIQGQACHARSRQDAQLAYPARAVAATCCLANSLTGPSWWAIACRPLSPRSRNIGLGALLLLCGERIEIDELRIVRIGIAVEPSAAMNVHQGLHTPGIQIVHMLMPQRERQQHFWQPDQRERRNPAHLAALPPKQRIERVN